MQNNIGDGFLWPTLYYSAEYEYTIWLIIWAE